MSVPVQHTFGGVLPPVAAPCERRSPGHLSVGADGSAYTGERLHIIVSDGPSFLRTTSQRKSHYTIPPELLNQGGLNGQW